MALLQSGQQRLLFSPVNLPTQDKNTMATTSMSEDSIADNDEPPDELLMATPRARALSPLAGPPATFVRKQELFQRKQSTSLLTQMIHTSESESQAEDENIFSDARRAHSSASTWSHGSVASTAELTSDSHFSPATTASPSPSMLPTLLHGLPPVFNTKPFGGACTVRTISSDSIGPLQTTAPVTPAQSLTQTFEAGLGRKRCIQFACGGRKESAVATEQEAEKPRAVEPTKRACMLKFVCPTRQESVVVPAPTEAPKRQCSIKFTCPSKNATEHVEAPKARLASPPPSTRSFPVSPKAATRIHRGSDSTVRNDSPKSVRKVPSSLRNRRKPSVDLEIDRYEATRFHEFASSDEEVDDWTQESTCHRTRLTVSDTLSKENTIRKACTEAEEEAEEEEDLDNASDGDEDEDDEDEDDDDEDEDVDDDDDDAAESATYSSDEGFASDDEGGFACSDDESDAGSDFEWWAPGRRASTIEPIEHIRPTQRRTSSASSIESISGDNKDQGIKIPSRSRPRRLQKTGRPITPELPDSTDFVCGTLDEDRPAEVAYLQHLEKRRLANRRQVPQDIDPTFPESDPEMDEEDEDSDHNVSESDQHTFIHGQMDDHEDENEDVEMHEVGDVIPQKRSPSHSPRRMRSPPPNKRANHRSPPPRRLFGASPQRRCRSPPPARPLRSPPPTRRPSVKQPKQLPVGLAIRPRLIRQSSSVPRSGYDSARHSLHPEFDIGNDDDEQIGIPVRTAIDIVKGLERKRQRRREKLYEKHCRNKSKRPEKVLQPGKGCERMREVGIELNNYRGKKQQVYPPGLPIPGVEQTLSNEMHILSI